MRRGHEDSGSELTLAAYTRDVLTGAIPHPNFDESNIDRGVFPQQRDVGKLATPEEFLHHYQAVVVAVDLLR